MHCTYPHRWAGFLVAALCALPALALVSCQAAAPPPVVMDDSLVGQVMGLPRTGENALSTMPSVVGLSTALGSALDAALAGDLALTQTQAAAFGYEALELAEEGQRFFVLREKTDTGAMIGATVVIALNPARDAILEAPHSLKDWHTGIQALAWLPKLSVRAAIISGANRCASRGFTSCSGTTGICGSRQAYRDSDVAHTEQSLFHLAHLDLTGRWPNAVVVQPHGFSGQGTPSVFVLSDGTRELRPSDPHLVGRVRNRVRDALGFPAVAVSCQDPDDLRFGYRPLCARTTVQGRHLNGSSEPCGTEATVSSQRFLHIEQQIAGRRIFGRDWRNLESDVTAAALFRALREELPCIQAGCAPL